MAPRMAFVGMGLMGRAMAQNLAAKAGLDGPIVLWNRTTATADEVAGQIGKARVASSLEDVASSADVIWSCLENDVAVEEVYGKLLATDVKGKVFADCSSIPVGTANAIAERVHAAGAEFLAVPVFGDPGMAQKAQLICILAGPKSAAERVKPYLLNVVAHTVVDMSDAKPGDALKIKLIGNTLLMSAMNSVGEALTFADKTGVGAGAMADLIGALFPRPPHKLYLDRMMSGDYHSGKAMADLAMARGLAAKVLMMADQSGSSVPGFRVAVDRLAEAEQAHHSQADITAIYGAIRVASGLPFKIDGPEKKE